MINFTILTDTPVRLRNFLISRGIVELQTVTNPDGTETQHLVGARPGIEIVEVPNSIVTNPGSGGSPLEPGHVPPTYDTRRAFMVKFAHESADNEVDGPTTNPDGTPIDQYEWSKFGKWVKNNSTIAAAPPEWTVGGQPVGNVRKINGEQVWLAHENPERFGVWQ